MTGTTTAATSRARGASRARPLPVLGCAALAAGAVVCPLASAPTSARTAAGGTSATPRRRRVSRAELLEAAGQLVLWDWRPPLRALPEHARQTGLLGDAVLRLRLDLRWSLPNLADAAGLSWRRVSRIEKGGMPTMGEVERLAGALSVDAEDLGDLRAGRSDARSRPVARVALQPTVAPGAPGSPTWDALTWEHDPYAQAAVVRGVEMSTEAIAELTGWSHRTVQRALESGLAKLAGSDESVDAGRAARLGSPNAG